MSKKWLNRRRGVLAASGNGMQRRASGGVPIPNAARTPRLRGEGLAPHLRGEASRSLVMAIGWWLVGAMALTAQAETVIINPGVGVTSNVEEKITGTTDVSIRSGLVTLNGENDYTGWTTVSNGTLIVTNAAAAGAASSVGTNGWVDVQNGVFRYDGPSGATFGHSVTGTLPKTEHTNSVSAFDIRQDLKFTKFFSTGYSPCVKTGAGSMIFEGETSSTAFYFMQSTPSSSSYGINKRKLQFVLPGDGTAPMTGLATVAFLQGKIILNKGKFYVVQTGGSTLLGGWTAGEGEQESDFEFVVNGGYATISTQQGLGQRHGIEGYNTPNGPAKAYLTINGGTCEQSGGQSFTIGSLDDGPTIDGVKRDFNSDLKLEVNTNGTYTHGSSYSGLNVYQRKGQPARIIGNGGTLIDYVVKVGGAATSGDTTGTLLVDLSNKAKFYNLKWVNNVGNVATQPPVQINIKSGSAFYTHVMMANDASKPGNTSILIDGGTYGIYNSKDGSDSHKQTYVQRKVIAPAWLTKLELGAGGAKLVSQALSKTGNLPNIAIFEKGFSTEESLAATNGVDGGLTIASRTSEHMVELAGANTYKGPTVLKSGILTLSGDGVIPEASAFTAQLGAILYVCTKDITLKTAKFEAGSIIKVMKGKKLIITDTVDFEDGVSVMFVDENGEELTEAETGVEFIQVPENQKEKLNAIRVHGICNSALYYTAYAVTTAEGVSTLKVDLAARTDTASPTETTATWTGSGTDDALTTDGNWDGGAAPAFDGGCLATFSESDGRATVSGEKAFRGIQLGDNSFTFAKDNDYAFILLKAAAGLQFANLTEARTLKFSVPVESEVAQTWTLPANATVEFADRVRFNGTVKATDYSGGNIAFTGGRVEAGNMRFAATNMTVFFSGDINNLDGTASTDYGLDAAGTIVLQSLKPADGTTVGSRNVFSNAVIRKAIYVLTGIGGHCYDWLESLPNTTNIFKGFLRTELPYRYLKLGAGSTTIIDGTVSFGWSMGTHGTGTLIFRQPLKQGGGRFLVESAATVRFETTGNTWNERMNVKADGCRFEYVVDDTFATVKASSYLDLAEDDRYCTNDIYGTTQHFPNIYTKSQKPVITGTYGSKIVITTGATAGTDSYGNVRICCRVEDGVSLEVDAEGDLVLASREFASCGDLIATKGALRLENGAKWLNGTNFTAKGTGKLKFTAANQVNSDFAVLHVAGNGKVEIPEDVTNVVYRAETNGVWLAAGNYTCTGDDGAEGATGIPQLTGKGVLSVLSTTYDVSGGSEPDVTNVVITESWVNEYVKSGNVTDTPTGGNGYPYWKSYVLGLTPTNPVSKPIIKGVQNADPNKLAFRLGNVTYNAASGVKATYTVRASDTVSGTFTDVCDPVDADKDATVALPGTAVKYYKVYINYSN